MSKSEAAKDYMWQIAAEIADDAVGDKPVSNAEWEEILNESYLALVRVEADIRKRMKEGVR